MFPFNIDKAIQAAALLLRSRELQEMGRLRLVKLLCIAERESFQDRGRPIIGDQMVSMKYGPVLSRVYDAIKGTGFCAPAWAKFFRQDGIAVRMVLDPGISALSKYEAEKLTEVELRYRDWNDFDIVNETHKFREWQDPGNSSIPIELQSVLDAVGRADKVGTITRDAAIETDLLKALEG